MSKSAVQEKVITDHLGNVYASNKDMSDAYNIPYTTFMHRLSTGWELKDALLTPPQKAARKDHLGNEYDSLNDMAKAYGLTRDALDARLRSGMSIEEALMQPKQQRGRICDHKDIEYTSLKEMAEAYNLPLSLVSKRLKKGWTVKDALEKESRKGSVHDHLGNEYPSVTEMCKTYNIDRNTFANRRRSGWSLKDALETPKIKDLPQKEDKSRLGETRVMNCGLKATIIAYRNVHDIVIRFEDGIEVSTHYKEFAKGSVGHPTLMSHGHRSGTFAGFNTKFISKGHFECTCLKCQLKDILTPQDMIKHQKTCPKR